MRKNIYLTIDDSPSIHTHKKVEYLRNHKIPALFFCRGEFIEKHPQEVINIIQNGFLVGNHSYSHPYFSEISLDDCIEEILKTEDLINQVYSAAKITRPAKVIRFPFGDLGRDNEAALNDFLTADHFEKVHFGELTSTQSLSAPWSWDSEDYKTRLINNPTHYLQELQKHSTGNPSGDEILLLHDFDHTHHLFEITMDFLKAKEVSFLKLS